MRDTVRASALGRQTDADPQRLGCVKSRRMPYELRIRALYDAFNARDIDATIAAMSDDVDWPNAWEGGRLHGHEAVRDYWTRQWAQIEPRVQPISIAMRPDGLIEVDVHQQVRSPAGELLSDGRVLHVYELRDGLITRMHVEEPS